MGTRHGRVPALALLIVSSACNQSARSGDATTAAEPSVASSPPISTRANAAFPTPAFADISDDPVSDDTAAEYQVALRDMADGAGMAATVLTAVGTWTGVTGMADRDRAVGVDDQFAIASLTKPVVAAQVMQMVEAGELGLDDLASDHLPADLDFDTNAATIRDLLGQHSGIPDYYPVVHDRLSRDLQRAWRPSDLLALIGSDRDPAGAIFEYTDTNFLLLGLVIEHVRGRPIAEVLRDGVLSIDGVERLIYQPGETPTAPMAMPFG